MPEEVREVIRQALRSLPSLAATSPGTPPEIDGIYFPEAHAEVLDPDVSLVIGNRGMGKSFWSLALADDTLRPIIAERYLASRKLHLEDLDVYLGFADAEGVIGAVSQPELDAIKPSVKTELIWRALIIRKLAPIADVIVPDTLPKAIKWVQENPTEQLALLKEADRRLTAQNRRVLFIFDQLEKLAEGWERIQALTSGLVKTSLAMKSYRSIKTKIFMRPDQAEDKTLFHFPDASKILGGQKRLSWRVTDLYGLLFFEILRHVPAQAAFSHICRSVNVNFDDVDVIAGIPRTLVGNADKQMAVFTKIAGEFMGQSSKRGRTYTWIPTHLADARGEISPRVFLKVMKTAAEHSDPPPENTAIDFRGVEEGVRDASGNRLNELEEDYPWVSTTLEPLRGLLVPCDRSEIAARWKDANVGTTIIAKFKGKDAPLDIIMAELLDDDVTDPLIKLLREVAVLEVRSNGKINVPDIFRVKAGIRRKGGLTPQQRLKFQI